MKIKKYLESSPVFTLTRAYEKIIVDLQLRLKREGVNLTQAWIVVALFFENKPASPSRLAKTLETSPSNISHSLKKLIQAGWAHRLLDNSDGRAFFIELTPSGKKRAVQLIRIFDGLQAVFENQVGERGLMVWNKRAKMIEEVYKWKYSSTSDIF